MDRTPGRDAPAIVGRRLELSAIDAFVDGVASGVRTLVLAGEPGIGKTTLWRRGAHGCVRAGMRVLRARPASDETTLSSGGLADLFGDDVLEGDGDDAFAGARAALAALRTMAERGPVVIAIDDLQWLDLRSYRALRYALRRFDVEPVGVLATTREGDDVPGAATFADVVPPGRASHVRVAPLSIAEIREVLASTTATVPPPVLQRIYEVSGGNPLYALELARVLAVRHDAGGPPDDTVRLPGSLQAAIERRLEDAPAEVVPVLVVVSALGTPRLADVRAVLPGEDVDELVRRARRQDLLVVEDDLRVRFSHPLLASGVYARIDPIERHALHARLADVAQGAEAKAHHLAASTSEPDAEVAALVESAAEQAGARGAWDRAAALARASVRLTPPDDGEAARRRALAEIEDVAAAGEAGRALRLADELVASTPPGPALARVLLVRADLEDDDMATAVSLLERAVREAAGDDGLRARVLLHLADTGVLYRTPLSEATALVREAVAIAERIGDDDLRRVASEDLAYYGVMAGAPPPLREAPAPEPGRSPTELHTPHTFEARWMLWSGDLAAARERFATDLSRPGGELQRPFRLGELALLELAAGNLADAARLAAEGVRGARDAESTYAERRIASVVALVDAWLGRIDDARRLAASIVDEEVAKGDRAGIARARLALGVALAADGSFGPAADELHAAAETLATMGIGHPGPFRVLPDGVETLCLAGRVADAGTLADRFEEQAARCASRWAAAAARAARGHVRLASGDARAAAADLAAALDDLDAMGYALEAARAALGLGRALLKEGRRTAASDTLADARGRFAAIGAPVWERRAADALERAAPGRAAGELTVTERLVAAHVADGRRNKEIAQALFVSVATVEAHLTRIYRKLGVRGRSELAALVTSGSVDVVTPRSEP